MKNYKKYLAMLLSLVLCSLCMIPTVFADDKDDEETVDEGFVNVTDFGANGTDRSDDYDAFAAALATGKSIYVPKGQYYFSKPLVIENRVIRGSSARKTTFHGTSTNPKDPIVILQGKTSFYDIGCRFNASQITMNEQEGDRVGLQLGSEGHPLLEGSVIHAYYSDYTGTSIYNPPNAGCSGILLENVEISHYTYRGIDMQGENRFMNTYTNMYIGSNYNINDSTELIFQNAGFALEGSEIGATVNQLNVEHDRETNAIIFKNVKGLNASTIHIEGTSIHQANMGYIFCENTTGYIGAYTAYFTFVKYEDNSMVCFGNSQKGDVLTIATMNCKGINNPSSGGGHDNWRAELTAAGEVVGLNGPIASTFVTFNRRNGATGNYAVNMLTYNSYCYHGDYAHYPVSSRGNVKVYVEYQ